MNQKKGVKWNLQKIDWQPLLWVSLETWVIEYLERTVDKTISEWLLDKSRVTQAPCWEFSDPLAHNDTDHSKTGLLYQAGQAGTNQASFLESKNKEHTAAAVRKRFCVIQIYYGGY